MADAAAPGSAEQQAVVLQDLQFNYPGCNAFLKGIDLQLPKGSRTLLIGANGAGVFTVAIQQATRMAAMLQHQLLLQLLSPRHVQACGLGNATINIQYRLHRTSASPAFRILAVRSLTFLMWMLM